MRAISNITLSIASSEPVFEGGGRRSPLTVRRSARARRMRLIVDPRDGAVRLTLPARASLRQALKWVEEKRGWIETTLATLPATVPLGAGAILLFQGEDLLIDWSAAHPRTIRVEGTRLIVGGPEDHVGARVLRWLKAQARSRLETETRRYAERAGVVVARVGIGDARSRWGSCSSSGDIRYSWRLILAPPAVLEATVAHEVAHRLHMHHGPEFHQAVAHLLGRDPKMERAWLKANGSKLHAVGR
jgi:predicted metal-dependent hydrolase